MGSPPIAENRPPMYTSAPWATRVLTVPPDTSPSATHSPVLLSSIATPCAASEPILEKAPPMKSAVALEAVACTTPSTMCSESFSQVLPVHATSPPHRRDPHVWNARVNAPPTTSFPWNSARV